MSFSNAYVAVRTIDTSGDPDRDGGPVLPLTWGVSKQGLTGWWMLTHPSGDLLAVYRVNALAGEALWAVLGPQARLEALAADRPDAMPARELWRRRDETTVEPGASFSPRQMVRGFRTWRCDVIEDDGEGPTAKADVVRVLAAEGVVLPNLGVDPLPWDLDASGNLVPQASAVRRVTALHRPALHITGAGRGDHLVLEAEPDRGA